MSVDFNLPKKIRDRKLRKALLVGLYESRGVGNGEIDGRTLADVVNVTRNGGQKFEDDGHAMALVRDLINKGYVRERLLTRRKGQPLGLDFISLAITACGVSLMEESVTPDPDVEDDRATD